MLIRPFQLIGTSTSALQIEFVEFVAEFGKLAKTNNTLIIPSNLSDIAGMIAAATSVIKGQSVNSGKTKT